MLWINIAMEEWVNWVTEALTSPFSFNFLFFFTGHCGTLMVRDSSGLGLWFAVWDGGP